jgi:dienelactone hydrolase
MNTQELTYEIDGIEYIGYIAYDDNISFEKPAVLIAHDWSGRNALAESKARELAEQGYVGFALDMYGEAKQGKTNEEKTALITPLLSDRGVLQKRMSAALETCRNLPFVASDKIMAMGYCFGGLCVLDLARTGANILGVVSFHGLLNAPEQKLCAKIKSKVLVLHGYDDPMVQPEALQAFANEMSEAQVDWQLHSYGNTLHAFTNPLANDPNFGTVYSEVADKRSWKATLNFFDELV